jgi:hypothetical protein
MLWPNWPRRGRSTKVWEVDGERERALDGREVVRRISGGRRRLVLLLMLLMLWRRFMVFDGY